MDIIVALRGPDGCPWDKQQTHQSLREDFIQECYEVLEALDENSASKLQEELGDLLLHIVLQVQIATEAGEFTLGEVLQSINSKLINRHPHVFGDARMQDLQEIKQSWQSLKKKEKGTDWSIIASVPKTMPALSYAEEIQHRVAGAGFDWAEDSGVLAKLAEEVEEINQSTSQVEKTEEYGDLLFTLVNIARRQGVDSEVALREANRKFARRFRYMEELCRQRKQRFENLSFQAQNALWEEAKRKLNLSEETG